MNHAHCWIRSAALPVLCVLAACQRPSPSDAPAVVPPAESAGKADSATKPLPTASGAAMVFIRGGEFLMGTDQDDEQPARRVRVDSFYIDCTEVTQQSFESLMGRNPARFPGAERPVERASWLWAVQFCNMRSLREGRTPCYDPDTLECDFGADGYRLPTEAEWEYACRAGTDSEWSFGGDPAKLGRHAWFKDNAEKTTHPVRQKSPNAWGLYDMHGNVAEWCQDYYAEVYDDQQTQNPRGPEAGDERVLRGGSWKTSADACRSAARFSQPPGLADVCFGYDAYGFRCVRRATETPPE